MSALFNFQSLLTVVLLLICTCAYIRSIAPSLLDKNKTGYCAIILTGCKHCTFLCPNKVMVGEYSATSLRIWKGHTLLPLFVDMSGFFGIFWKCARIGERKSPYVAVCCIAMALSILFWS